MIRAPRYAVSVAPLRHAAAVTKDMFTLLILPRARVVAAMLVIYEDAARAMLRYALRAATRKEQA